MFDYYSLKPAKPQYLVSDPRLHHYIYERLVAVSRSKLIEFENTLLKKLKGAERRDLLFSNIF
jgi:hypothetical protein